MILPFMEQTPLYDSGGFTWRFYEGPNDTRRRTTWAGFHLPIGSSFHCAAIKATLVRRLNEGFKLWVGPQNTAVPSEIGDQNGVFNYGKLRDNPPSTGNLALRTKRASATSPTVRQIRSWLAKYWSATTTMPPTVKATLCEPIAFPVWRPRKFWTPAELEQYGHPMSWRQLATITAITVATGRARCRLKRSSIRWPHRTGSFPTCQECCTDADGWTAGGVSIAKFAPRRIDARDGRRVRTQFMSPRPSTCPPISTLGAINDGNSATMP